MEIFLNRQKIDFEADPEEKVGEIVLTLFRWLENDGGKIDSFSIDGKSLDDVFETLKDESHREIDKIEIGYTPAEWIRTIWTHENPKELLKNITEGLLTREEEVKKFAVDIQMDRAQEAFATAADFIHEIRRMIMTVSRLTEEHIFTSEKKIGPDLSLGEFTDTINTLLKEINTSLENEDITLTGDLLEYEMLPLIHSLNDFISGT